MSQNIPLSQDEILALLYLPYFRIPNQLSPFYPLQLHQTGADLNFPEDGFSLLEEKELWDSHSQELTLEARKMFVPVFSPSARVMLFRGAYALTPFQEFYIFKKYVVQYFESAEPGFRALEEKNLVEHMRKIFSDKRTPFTENRLSLFEPEYIGLMLLCQLRIEGETPDLNRILQDFQQKIYGGGIDMPILGKLRAEERNRNPALREDVLARAVESLLSEGFISSTTNATLEPAPLIEDLFTKIHHTKGLYLIREEFDGEQILAREASIFPGDRGYFVGRCSYHQQFQTRIVHIEDLEWHTLYRLINEIVRHRDYLPQLTLEVTRRFRAHLRC